MIKKKSVKIGSYLLSWLILSCFIFPVLFGGIGGGIKFFEMFNADNTFSVSIYRGIQIAWFLSIEIIISFTVFVPFIIIIVFIEFICQKRNIFVSILTPVMYLLALLSVLFFSSMKINSIIGFSLLSLLSFISPKLILKKFFIKNTNILNIDG